MTTTADLRECAGAIESTFLQNDQIRKDYGGLLRKAAADLHFAADELDRREWQTISTAPKGKYVLVKAHKSGYTPCVAMYGFCNRALPEGWFSDLYDSATLPIPFEPTHWMPLPEPPHD